VAPEFNLRIFVGNEKCPPKELPTGYVHVLRARICQIVRCPILLSLLFMKGLCYVSPVFFLAFIFLLINNFAKLEKSTRRYFWRQSAAGEQG
jgi:hypothetical protein